MSEATDPGADRGADPRLRFDTPMLCECGGIGVVTDAADAGDGWWMIAWHVEHRGRCAGLQVPDRAYLVDMAAMEAGEWTLPAWRPGTCPSPSGRLPSAPPGRRRPASGAGIRRGGTACAAPTTGWPGHD